MELKNVERGRIKEYAEKYGVKYVEGAKPWFEKGDIALPSATQNEINEEAAKALVANGVIAVSEGANMPTTPEAIKVFQDAKILYSPGKAANAGGVAVSGLEMSQNSERLSWSREEVDNKLHDIMNDIHANCVKYGTEPDGYINYVKGANVGGFLKVAKAMMACVLNIKHHTILYGGTLRERCPPFYALYICSKKRNSTECNGITPAVYRPNRHGRR